jgi:MoxR-like ATPase
VGGLEVETLRAVTSAAEVVELQAMMPLVAIPEAVERYILQVVAATRTDPSILLGASPRASITLGKAARVMAIADGRWTVFPDDVRALLRPVLAHRMMLSPEAILRGEGVDDVLDRLTNRVKPPLGVTATPPPKPTMATRGSPNGEATTRSARRRGASRTAG